MIKLMAWGFDSFFCKMVHCQLLVSNIVGVLCGK